MDLMNRVFHECLDHFVIVFIDDILIFSKSMKNMRSTWELFYKFEGEEARCKV